MSGRNYRQSHDGIPSSGPKGRLGEYLRAATIGDRMVVLDIAASRIQHSKQLNESTGKTVMRNMNTARVDHRSTVQQPNAPATQPSAHVAHTEIDVQNASAAAREHAASSDDAMFSQIVNNEFNEAVPPQARYVDKLTAGTVDTASEIQANTVPQAPQTQILDRNPALAQNARVQLEAINGPATPPPAVAPPLTEADLSSRATLTYGQIAQELQPRQFEDAGAGYGQ